MLRGFLAGPGDQEDRVVHAEGRQEQKGEQGGGVVQSRKAEDVQARPAAHAQRGQRAQDRRGQQRGWREGRPQQHVEDDQDDGQDRRDQQHPVMGGRVANVQGLRVSAAHQRVRVGGPCRIPQRGNDVECPL
ncbi:hypothetical protein A5621_14460 [Mycobacterium colombiense]|nr:hypothetical protein A5621_14460 [Mycobacterium colombiense]